MTQRLLLIGPLPPPDGGTTIPFSLFCNYVEKNFHSKFSVSVVNSTTGDKSSTSIFAPTMLLRILPLIGRIIFHSLRNDRIVIFGSQRFITLIGSFVVILTRPFGRRVFLRINGGGYDLFYKSSSSITRWLIHNVMAKADSIIVQTELVRSVMTEVWKDNVHAVSNYRELIPFNPDSRTYSQDKVRFIYTGIVRQLKGSGELLNAFVRLNRMLAENGHSIETRLDLYGRVFDSANEPLDIAQFREQSNIAFHGQTKNSDLMKEYANADVFVFPSYWPTEGHPGSVVEALMHGLPVITTNWRAINEVIRDGVNGLLCQTQSVDSLVEAMYTLAIDPEKRRTLSKAAYDSASSFDENLVCAQMAECFDLGSGPVAARIES